MGLEGRMTLTDHLVGIRDALKGGRFPNEAAISQGVVLRLLRALEWPVDDPQVVFPEYTVEARRVDFALCPRPQKPVVFIEVKQVGQTAGADKQLFEYAFHAGVPMAVLTDGQEWNFYLPAEQGAYEERRVYKLDLLERDLGESARIFSRYLAYSDVCSGQAIDHAKADYRNVARQREIEGTLPKAWGRLIEEPDELLVELLAKKVESLCGYRPDASLVGTFLERQTRQLTEVMSDQRHASPPHQFDAGTTEPGSQKRVPGRRGPRLASRRMRAGCEPKHNPKELVVSFEGGSVKSWPLPAREDKHAIRRIRDQAVRFGEENGATLGQIDAIKKALTAAGYHLTK